MPAGPSTGYLQGLSPRPGAAATAPALSPPSSQGTGTAVVRTCRGRVCLQGRTRAPLAHKARPQTGPPPSTRLPSGTNDSGRGAPGSSSGSGCGLAVSSGTAPKLSTAPSAAAPGCHAGSDPALSSFSRKRVPINTGPTPRGEGAPASWAPQHTSRPRRRPTGARLPAGLCPGPPHTTARTGVPSGG